MPHEAVFIKVDSANNGCPKHCSKVDLILKGDDKTNEL